MTAKSLIKKILIHTCVWYTVVMGAYAFLMCLVHAGTGTILIEAAKSLMFLLFSLLVAGAGVVLRIPNMNGVLRTAIHYVVTLAALLATFVLPMGTTPSFYLVASVIYTVIYLVILGIASIFRSRYSRLADKEAAYQKQFKGKH